MSGSRVSPETVPSADEAEGGLKLRRPRARRVRRGPLRRRGGGRVETRSGSRPARSSVVPSADEAEGGLKRHALRIWEHGRRPLRRRGGGRVETCPSRSSPSALESPPPTRRRAG